MGLVAMGGEGWSNPPHENDGIFDTDGVVSV